MRGVLGGEVRFVPVWHFGTSNIQDVWSFYVSPSRRRNEKRDAKLWNCLNILSHRQAPLSLAATERNNRVNKLSAYHGV